MPEEEGTLPGQSQDHQPGSEAEMTSAPQSQDAGYKGSGKLQNKVALITGGDSGIGRAVAIVFAKEGADCAISYLNEEDAQESKRPAEELGRKCVLYAFLASDDSSYISGQILHPNGGSVVNG